MTPAKTRIAPELLNLASELELVLNRLKRCEELELDEEEFANKQRQHWYKRTNELIDDMLTVLHIT